MKLLISTVFFLFQFFARGGQDSVIYTRDFSFKEGIYLNFFQFKNNDPIPLSSIVSRYDKNDKEFLLKVLSHNTLIYRDSLGKENKVSIDNIWGYSINKSVYTKTINTFSKVQIIGSICHFLGLFETYTTIPDPYYGNTQSQRNYRSEQAIIDMETGNIYEFNVKSLENILQRDPVLFKEFSALRKKKKRTSIFIFMKRYNEAHPIYFKVN